MVQIRKFGFPLAFVLWAIAIALPLLDRPTGLEVAARLVAVVGLLVSGGAMFVALRKGGPGSTAAGSASLAPAVGRAGQVRSLIAIGVALVAALAAFVLVRQLPPAGH